MVCLRNICINTLHKGDNDENNNNNNNNKYLQILTCLEDNFDAGSWTGYLAVWCT
jgi:hypothetical protein